jgi:hypothetical protein
VVADRNLVHPVVGALIEQFSGIQYGWEDILKRWFGLLSAVLLLSVVSACSSGEPDQLSMQVDGPALVMFYTDN